MFGEAMSPPISAPCFFPPFLLSSIYLFSSDMIFLNASICALTYSDFSPSEDLPRKAATLDYTSLSFSLS